MHEYVKSLFSFYLTNEAVNQDKVKMQTWLFVSHSLRDLSTVACFKVPSDSPSPLPQNSLLSFFVHVHNGLFSTISSLVLPLSVVSCKLCVIWLVSGVVLLRPKLLTDSIGLCSLRTWTGYLRLLHNYCPTGSSWKLFFSFFFFLFLKTTTILFYCVGPLSQSVVNIKKKNLQYTSVVCIS